MQSNLSKNRTFKVNLNAIELNCFSSVSNDDERWLWHFRFGHLNFRSLNQLGAKGMVKGLPIIRQPDGLCEGCLTSKQPRNSVKEYSHSRAKHPLEVVYSDVCGPMETSSLGGNRYFITFVDEFTRKTWLYLIKEKSEVFSVFVKFFALAERQSGRKMKILKTDGGGEYKSNEFSAFCDGKGLIHEVTSPYTPQHNGMAVRRNRTLVDMARCMIKGKQLSKSYWGEAVSTAAYLLNRCPTNQKGNLTPEELFTGIRPSVKHLRIFGSICHRHIPDERRRKLDDKREKMVLIGYDPTGAYRLYDPIKKKVTISRDVVIDENVSWQDKVDKPVG